MSGLHLQLAGAAALHVDGIDMAQLVRDLGAASAASKSDDLLRLCLTARRVLAYMYVDGTGVNASEEAAWLTAFRNMDICARSNSLSAMQAIAENFPRRSLVSLALVPTV